MVSVIVPVYNAEKWISKCLDSLVSQTVFEQMEIVIIDDGSMDRSGVIIDNYVQKYGNVICRHIKNGGVSKARNVGLDICGGEYVAFVDADDYFDSNFIENLLVAMDSQFDITCSGFIAEYQRKSVRRCSNEECVLDNKEAMREFLLAGKLEPNIWDKLFRKSIIGEKRFDTSIAIAEDKLFLFNCLKEVRAIRLIAEANYHYVMNDESACRKEFSEKNFHSIQVADYICDVIRLDYPQLYDLAQSMAIDVKCRVYGDMYRNEAQIKYPEEYTKLKREIREFSITTKLKNSNKKHTVALIAAKVSPVLYNFLKHDLRLQYE